MGIILLTASAQLPLFLCEYKDQSLVKQTYTIIFLLPFEFSTIPGQFYVVISVVRDSKYYWVMA